MCLYAHNTKPLVSDKDLTVFKLLRKYKGKITTPYQYSAVSLGCTLKAEGNFPMLPSDWSNNEVWAGAIHADTLLGRVEKCLDDIEQVFYVKSIIKAGTPFYVQTDMKEIAAKEMLITDKAVKSIDEETCSEVGETLDELRRLAFGQDFMTNKDGVRVGDVLLTDCKTFVHLEDLDIGLASEMMGVVGFIRPDGTPQVISLDQITGKFYNGDETDCKYSEGSVGNRLQAFSDLNGYWRCKRFIEAVGEEIHKYPAIKFCHGYGDEHGLPGEWYLPSIGEMEQVIRNSYFINNTIEAISYYSMLSWKVYKEIQYWSSTPFNRCHIWISNYIASLLYRCNATNYQSVRPFLYLG